MISFCSSVSLPSSSMNVFRLKLSGDCPWNNVFLIGMRSTKFPSVDNNIVSLTGTDVTVAPYFRAHSILSNMIFSVIKGLTASCITIISSSLILFISIDLITLCMESILSVPPFTIIILEIFSLSKYFSSNVLTYSL